jgi:hypothetical protein
VSTHPPIHPLTHSLTHSLTHLPTYPPSHPCSAVDDFTAEQDTDLSFRKGDTVVVARRIDEAWLEGTHASSGHMDVKMFPKDFVELLPPPPELNTPWARATDVFAAESSDELSISPGDVIYLVERPADEWLVGVCCGVKGMFPEGFVTVEVALPGDLAKASSSVEPTTTSTTPASATTAPAARRRSSGSTEVPAEVTDLASPLPPLPQHDGEDETNPLPTEKSTPVAKQSKPTPLATTPVVAAKPKPPVLAKPGKPPPPVAKRPSGGDASLSTSFDYSGEQAYDHPSTAVRDGFAVDGRDLTDRGTQQANRASLLPGGSVKSPSPTKPKPPRAAPPKPAARPPPKAEACSGGERVPPPKPAKPSRPGSAARSAVGANSDGNAGRDDKQHALQPPLPSRRASVSLRAKGGPPSRPLTMVDQIPDEVAGEGEVRVR